MNIFWKSKTVREQQREANRELQKVNRSIERDRNFLEREERKLELEIKKMARDGNKEGCAILAKELVQLRRQKMRSVAASTRIHGIAAQNKMMGASVALTDAMGSASRTMSTVNRLMQPQRLAHDMRAFEEATMKMGMTSEFVDDALNDILAESGDEEESKKIVTQVLDEIGIDISGQMSKLPNAIKEDFPKKSRLPTDDEIQAELAKLKLPE